MCRNFVSLSLLVVVALVAAPALANTIVYNFAGDSLQGWTPLTGGTPSQSLAGNSNYYYGASTNSPGGIGPQSGSSYLLTITYAGGAGDGSSEPTATLASPAFTLDGSGALTFYLQGGSMNVGAEITNVSQIPLTRTGDSNNTAAGGFEGVACDTS